MITEALLNTDIIGNIIFKLKETGLAKFEFRSKINSTTSVFHCNVRLRPYCEVDDIQEALFDNWDDFKAFTDALPDSVHSDLRQFYDYEIEDIHDFDAFPTGVLYDAITEDVGDFDTHLLRVELEQMIDIDKFFFLESLEKYAGIVQFNREADSEQSEEEIDSKMKWENYK